MKQRYKFAMLALFFLLIVSQAYAIGITPGRKTFQFNPGESQTVTLTILNPEQEEFEAAIYATGELENYTSLSQSGIKFNKDEKEKTITYTLRLPTSFDTPGLHTSEIVVRKISPQQSGSTVITTMVAVVSQVHVMVPYPGKYAEADFYIAESKIGEPIDFYIRVNNLGEEDISEANAKITIYNAYSNQKITAIDTDSQSISTKSRKELRAVLQQTLDPGIYHATAQLNYDGKALIAENDFIVSGFLLRPLDISVRDFKLGEIAKFSILVENIGNQKVNAYSKIQLDDSEKKSIADIRSASIDIEPKGKEEMNSYWDTKDVEEGTYKGKLVLSYENKNDEKDIQATIKKDSIKTEILGFTGMAITETPSLVKDKTPVWIVLVALLVIINIGWFIYMKKRK